MLLLRAALGSTALINGGAYVLSHDGPVSITWTAGLLAVIGGGLLLIGCLTPFAAVAAGLSGALVTYTGLPSAVILDNSVSLFFVTSLTTAVVLLGPGAFSLDARLFGRREIIIPQFPSRRDAG